MMCFGQIGFAAAGPGRPPGHRCIEHRDRMRALELAKTAARLAAAAHCDLCDEDGFVVDKAGKLVLSDGYEVACYHGKAVDLDA
jgi:hypothetical protein